MVTQILAPDLAPRLRWQTAKVGVTKAKRQPKLPFAWSRDVRRSRRRFALAGVALAEFLDPSRGVDDLLLARVERVASRTHFDVQRLVNRRAGDERITAAARHLNFAVLRMNARFHCAPLHRAV